MTTETVRPRRTSGMLRIDGSAAQGAIGCCPIRTRTIDKPMAAPRELKLVFTCPACKHASQLAADRMEAVVGCPHCHAKVVIDREGIHNAEKRLRETRRNRHPKPEEYEYHRAPNDSMGRGWLWAGLFLLLLVTMLPLVFWWSGAHVPNDKDNLYLAAETFQSAWLEGAMDTASNFVLKRDLARLRQWSAPRRAALVAGFGSRFRGRITTIEILEKNGGHAVVCVAFEIGSREQQVFQDWKLVDGNWRLSLR